MKVQIRLVGFLAESGLPGGYRGGELEIKAGTTVRQVLARLQAPHEGPWLVLVGDAIASGQRVLEDGDVIKLVPRIGGG